MFMDSFDFLPLCAIINGKYFASHGGIGPTLKSINQINNLNRYQEPPDEGIFTDLLWADPIDNKSGNMKDTKFK